MPGPSIVVAALSEQNWPCEAIGFADEHCVGAGEAWGSTIDLSDSFYQLYDDEMAADFGIDYPETAEFYAVAEVYDDALWVSVGGDE